LSLKNNPMVKILLVAAFLNGIVCSGQPGKSEIKIPTDPEKSAQAKNIVLMIGDGMGLAQIYAGMTANKGNLNLERLPDIGFSKTYSNDDYITDSGAGATAIATGTKTYNGAISIDQQGIPCRTILEYAENHGKSTGLVVSCSITHATPACFVAHQSTRKNYEGIAMDLVESGVDVFFGGGLEYFIHRKDGKDLTKQLTEKGYQFIYSADSIRFANGNKVAGLLYLSEPPKCSEGRKDELGNAAIKTMEILSRDDDGFFLMIEGSQIDWGGHDNDKQYIIDEMLDFDRAIGMVLDFARNNDNTLVIVTADHETGGMGLTGGDMETGEVTAKFLTRDHTGVMVPVFAFGPGSESFKGIYENSEIFSKMMSAFGFIPDRIKN
jgi:alkaline phosphatase